MLRMKKNVEVVDGLIFDRSSASIQFQDTTIRYYPETRKQFRAIYTFFKVWKDLKDDRKSTINRCYTGKTLSEQDVQEYYRRFML